MSFRVSSISLMVAIKICSNLCISSAVHSTWSRWFRCFCNFWRLLQRWNYEKFTLFGRTQSLLIFQVFNNFVVISATFSGLQGNGTVAEILMNTLFRGLMSFMLIYVFLHPCNEISSEVGDLKKALWKLWSFYKILLI